MHRSGIKNAVHDFIARYLGESDFDGETSFTSLGLDYKDIEELVFRLEDQYGLTALTGQEDMLFSRITTPNQLTLFLQDLAEL